MTTYEFEDFNIEVDSRFTEFLVDFPTIPRYNDTWYAYPAFLKGLPKPTWGALKEFVEENYSALGREGLAYLGYISEIPSHVLDECVLGVPSSLNLLETSSSKPTYAWGGIRYSPLGGSFRKKHCKPRLSRTGGSEVQVMNYTYRPDFKYLTMPKEKTERFFGLELEVNSAIPWDQLYRIMTTVAPIQEAFLYAKQDSSISGVYQHNYELVTHPMSPRRMRIEFSRLFKKIKKLAEAKGLCMEDIFDHNTSSTGIHVHVSGRAFTPLSRTHRKKFAMFWNNPCRANHKFTAKLARRNLGHYCSPAYEYTGRTTAWCLRHGSIEGDRNSACNDQGGITSEVRVFRGEPTPHSVCHAIDTVEAVLDFTEAAPYSVFKSKMVPAFEDWLQTQNKKSYRALKET